MKDFPSSIYHLQFGENFGLKEATELLSYLSELGVEGVYCSPYLASSSSHGYDVIDPYRINPAVGTEKQYEHFCKKMKQLKFYHIADVIPNHMGIKGDNRWWQDVLEKGKVSPYARFFDIDWSGDKIILPILGEDRDFKVVQKRGKPWLAYHDWLLPLRNFSKKDSIKTLLDKQHYRLVSWKHSSKEVSYRRFFNINEMVGLRMEDKRVFDAYHRWIFQLLKEKKINGIRIDHPDGLLDPAQYFKELRKKQKGLVVVEKILGWEEELPDWEVEGTVGYEFLNMLTGIFVKKEPHITDIYQTFIGRKINFQDLVYEDKKFFIQTEMLGDLKRLNRLLPQSCLEAILELLAAFPVYRSYIAPKGKVSKRDLPYIQEAFAKARKRCSDQAGLDYLEKIFLLQEPTNREFILRFQQLSAPVMAKGFEDIALYNYNRLLALNEVGSSPDRDGVTKEQFHRFCQNKKKKWPYGFLTTSTHDCKRSHDVRMQLAVLSEMPEKWEKALKEWGRCNREYKTKIKGKLFPDRNAEYTLYQILLGAWQSRPTFKRLWQCFQKSIKEAREYTSWIEPNQEYEKACEQFLKSILSKQSPFLISFQAFQKELALYGEFNILSSSALHLGAPGIVDIYQGCENFRYLLVDPDNRTVPNFKKRESEKSCLHRKALHFRKTHRDLFLEGQYLPLQVRGPQKEHVVAYLRQDGGKRCLVAALRFFVTLQNLKKTSIILPEKMKRGVELFTERPFEGKEIMVDQLFAEAPYAWIFWEAEPMKKGPQS